MCFYQIDFKLMNYLILHRFNYSSSPKECDHLYNSLECQTVLVSHESILSFLIDRSQFE